MLARLAVFFFAAVVRVVVFFALLAVVVLVLRVVVLLVTLPSPVDSVAAFFVLDVERRDVEAAAAVAACSLPASAVADFLRVTWREEMPFC